MSTTNDINMNSIVVLAMDHWTHRESTTRELREGGVTSSLKLNLTDPCRIVPCWYHCWGMPGQRDGSPFAVYAQMQCREPKTGQEKVQFYCEDD